MGEKSETERKGREGDRGGGKRDRRREGGGWRVGGGERSEKTRGSLEVSWSVTRHCMYIYICLINFNLGANPWLDGAIYVIFIR